MNISIESITKKSKKNEKAIYICTSVTADVSY